MKKQVLSALCLSAVLVSGQAYAISTSIGGVKLNINTPQATTTSAATNANVTKIKSQAAALENSLKTVSSKYETTIEQMVATLLPADEVKELKAEAAKLKADAKNPVEINIDVAEDGTIMLNNALKSKDLSFLKNLSASKKTALKNEMSSLTSVKNSYVQIGTQATELVASIKADPKAALACAPELIQLGKTAKESAKQVKNITKLSSTLTSALSKSGVTLK